MAFPSDAALVETEPTVEHAGERYSVRTRSDGTEELTLIGFGRSGTGIYRAGGVSITDYIVLRGIQYGGGTPAVAAKLGDWMRDTDDLERELEKRRRRIAELAVRAGPSPGWVKQHRSAARIRELKRAFDSPVDVEFQPLVHPQVSVHLSDGAWNEMDAVIRDWSPHGVETGGYLLANEPQDRNPMMVVKATEPTRNSKHGRSEVQLGGPRTVLRELPDFLSHLVVVGDWHTHPSQGSAKPSSTDRESWAERVRLGGLPVYVSVIASRSTEGLGWLAPLYSAWVTYPKGGNKFVCEPATIEGR